MKYYINADDFGLTATKTAAIDKGMRSGMIRRASLMMNTPATEQAIALAREGGYENRLCLHLNLSQGRPLSDELRNTSFCDENGNIRRMKHRKMLMKCIAPRVRRGLRAECEAQLKRFRDSGFTSVHIDSHTWSMCSLPAWSAIKPLLKKYGFETTRTLDGHRLSSCGTLMRKYYERVFAGIKKELRLTDDWSGCANELERDVKRGIVKSDTIVELYVHPDMVDGIVMDTLYDYNHTNKPLSEICEIADKLGERIELP